MTTHISIKPKAPAIPALLPIIQFDNSENCRIWWATHCVNSDAKVQALDAMSVPLYRCPASSQMETKQMAMITATRLVEEERDTQFLNCTKAGGLLFAWHGSRALVQPLPASLRSAQ